MFVTLPAHALGAAGIEPDALTIVLYVPDSAVDAVRVRAALAERPGLRLVEADSRAAFDAVLASGNIDVVLCGLIHPQLDGLAVLAATRARDPHLPVVMLAEPGHEDLIESATRAGAWSYLIKTPRYPERLHHAIHAVLAQRHALERWRQAETAQARRQCLVAAFARQALERVSHLALARQALHVLAQGTNADCSRLMRIHPDGTRYRWVAHAGWTRPPLGASQPCGAHERWVLASPGPLAVADYRVETRFVPARDIAAQGLASGIEIRLMVGGAARAILGAYSRDVGWCNADNMEFIAIIAGILTNAIERARADTRLTWLNRALERKVDRRTAELRDAYRRIESFSYSIAHDLRAPLHVTSAFAGLLHDSDAATLSEEGRHSLERVMGGVARMAGLIDDVLAFSRQGFGPLDPQAVDMTAIARTAAAEFAVAHPRAHLRIDPLAPAYGDSGALARVFANLIGNAFKYSAPVAVPAIHVGCRREGAQTVYFVADNGVGFDPAFAARLFGLFQRMHSAREFSGSGVGLAIARQIVERHAGRIWAEATPGGGACFHFTLGRVAAPAG
jgi:signal transduction histidine kinase/DNA-binding NarL/FixJ family response regulator